MTTKGEGSSSGSKSSESKTSESKSSSAQSRYEMRDTTDANRKDVYLDGSMVAQVYQTDNGWDAYANGRPVISGADSEKAALEEVDKILNTR